MSMVTEADVKEQLGGFDIEVSDPTVIIRIQDICNENEIPADRFVDEWISYSLKSGELNFVLSPNVLDKFLPDLLKCCKVMPAPGAEKPVPVDAGEAKKLGEYVTADDMDLIEKYADEDTKQRARKEISSIQGLLAMDEREELNSPIVKKDLDEGTAYAARKNPSTVLTVINETNLPDDWRDPNQTTTWKNQSPPTDRPPCTLVLASSHPTVLPLTAPYKYMFPQFATEARVMSELTEEMAELIAIEADLPTFDTLEDGGQNVWVFGRVIPEMDPDNQDSNLRANTFALLGTRENPQNRWVKLDLSGMDRYSLFPGQNIAVRGRNEPNKKVLFVKELKLGVPPPLVGHPITTHPLSVYIAAGPYTPDTNLKFEPLRDLTRVVSEAKPDLLILFGPFVPDHNTALGTKEHQCTYKELFKKKVKPILEVSRNSGTKVILIPSMKDLFHHPIFPQPPYPDLDMTEYTTKGKENLKLSSYAQLFPDPAQFDFNSVRFAVTCTDIVTHMAKQEVAIEMKDRFSRILNHLLLQRRFYPLFPPSEEVNLEIVKGIHLGINIRPHVMILVSQMKEFLRMEGSTLCVNPGKLTKGKTGGSFCRLRITDTEVSGQIIKI